MAYKADEGTLRRLPNINSHPKYFLPLKTISMATMPWNPFAVCGIPHGGPVSCCGVTKKGQPCKNSVKFQDTKVGHQSWPLSPESRLTCQICSQSSVILLESSSARDGTVNGRPTKLASGGMKQPSATRRECRMALELPLHPLRIRASVRCGQCPGVALHQATPTGHLTGSDKTHRCRCQPTTSQCNHSIHL